MSYHSQQATNEERDLAAQEAIAERFAVVNETLSDGSIVYAVRFHCDYDPDKFVEIDCVDQAHAEALAEALRGGACNVEISE